MVSRFSTEYAGQLGIFGLLGFPDRANATHVELILSSRAYAVGIFEIRAPAVLTLLNTNGISTPWGDRICPPRSGVSQSTRYIQQGAPACSTLRLPSSCVFAARGWLLAIKIYRSHGVWLGNVCRNARIIGSGSSTLSR